jgi:hypothetical protein
MFMNRSIAAVGMSLALISGACSAENTPPPMSPTSTELAPGTDIETSIRRGVDKYTAAYGCPTPVAIEFADARMDSHMAGRSVAAYADPGKIVINSVLPEATRKLFQTEPKRAEYIGVHEASHACQKPNEKPFEPIKLPGEDVHITGVQGLRFILDKRAPEEPEVFIKKVDVEEGAAEVLAHNIVTDPTPVVDRPYNVWEELTKFLMSRSKMTPKELSQYVQNSDIYGFLSRVSGIKNPTQKDILDLVGAYQINRSGAVKQP